MDVMSIYNPTQIMQGDYCVLLNPGVIVGMGNKPLIITGKKSAVINGSFREVELCLEKFEKEYVLFNEVEENPSVETVVKATKIGIENGTDYIIAVGGGSAMDAAKAVALLVANPDKGTEIFNEKMPYDHIPIVAIPTTAGTGSEVTPFSILTYHEERTKRSIAQYVYPAVALLDSKFLATQSYEGIVNGAIDTLCHLVESYLNTNSNELNRLYSREGMRLFSEYKKSLAEDELNKDDYDKLLYAATLGGQAITATKTSLPHGLSYMVTYETGEAHGRACGRFLGEFVKMYEKNDAKSVKEVMELLGFGDTDEFVTYLDDLLKLDALPEGMYESTWASVKKNPAKLKNYPFEL